MPIAFVVAFPLVIPAGNPLLLLPLLFLVVIPAGNPLLLLPLLFLVVIPAGNPLLLLFFAFPLVIPAGNLLFRLTFCKSAASAQERMLAHCNVLDPTRVPLAARKAV
jgi:hypothetical protein